MESVTYNKSAITQILKDLNVLVVSIDRIGSAWHERESDEQYNKMFVKFFDEFGFSKKLASARTVLSEPFTSEAG